MTLSPMPQSDYVSGFSSDTLPLQGQFVRLGKGSLSAILERHAYPDHLAEILGEAVLLATLVGSRMKFEGRVMAQAEGDGPVSMLVGEYRKDGGLRGYARHEPDRWEWLNKVNKGEKPHMPQLFGPMGRLGLIIMQDNPNTQPYQGIVPLGKGSLAECAAEYFARSEQVDTCLQLKVCKNSDGDWIGSGIMIQRIAGDDLRGDTEDGWQEARALFSTIKDQELADEALSGEELLYRLFHEGGVRVEKHSTLADACTCNRERLIGTLQGMGDDSLRELVEADGNLSLDCQFCGRSYRIPIDEVTGPTS